MRFGLRGVAATLIGLLSAVRICAGPALAAEHARLDHWSLAVRLNRDLTYSEDIVQNWTLLTAQGVADAGRATVSFHPKTQSLQLLDAYVEQPDGTRVPVSAGDVFTRPSAADDAPGFTTMQTATLLFPQLRPGSRTHVDWRLVQRAPPSEGFNLWVQPPLAYPASRIEVRITAPAGLALQWRSRGGFAVHQQTRSGSRQISAVLLSNPAEVSGDDVVASSDFQPLFLVTTVPSAASLGASYYQQALPRMTVTPAIAKLAARLVGGRTGLAAARAIYDWVAANIRYVALYLDPNDGWVPHAAAEVLAKGYGDCKDHVVLMQALLAARGIPADAGMVDLGDRYRLLPLWLPEQFNHTVIYLPQFGVFANPTDPDASFEAIDRRLAGKSVVLATPTGQLVRIPERQPAEDRYQLDSTVTVDANGTIEGRTRISFSPRIDSDIRAAVASASTSADLADRLLADTPEGGYGALQSTDPHDLDHPLSVSGWWKSPHGLPLTVAGGYLAVPVGIDFEPIAGLRDYLSPERPPQRDFLARALDLTWRYTIRLPDGLQVLRLPRDIAFADRAGSYRAHYQQQRNEVRVERRLVIARDVFPAGAYGDFEQLLYQPLDDARSVVVLGTMTGRRSASRGVVRRDRARIAGSAALPGAG